MPAESFSTESLSRGSAEVVDPLPVATQMLGAVHHGGRSTHPYRALRRAGVDLEPLGFATPLRDGDDPAVIGRAIARVAAEAEHYGAFDEVQARPLQLGCRGGSGWFDVLAEQ